MIRIRLISLALAVFVAWALPTSARAHGTGARLLPPSDQVRGVLFHYSSGEPMAWARVKVFAPEAPGEFLVSRTDPNGTFVFLPDRPGVWRVQAQDDDGHKATLEVALPAPSGSGPHADPAASGPGKEAAAPQALPPAPPQDREQDPLLWRALLGISLIANLFLGLAFWRKRLSRP